VRLVHYTTQEYWDRVLAPQFPNAQTDITCSLLTFLAFDDHVDIYNWKRYRYWETQPILFNYCQYTLVHAAGRPEEDLRKEILKFLEQAVIWVTLEKLDRPRWTSGPWDFWYWPEQTTPLWIAGAANLFKTADYLMKNSSLTGSNHGAALVASYYGHYQIVELLIDKGADVNVWHEVYGTALQTASLNGHKDIAELLMNRGAGVDIQGGDYGTALQAHQQKATKTLLSC
jgi:hypothetical protein